MAEKSGGERSQWRLLAHDSLDGSGVAGEGIGFNQDGIQADVAFGDFKASRELAEELLNHGLLVDSDYRVVWTWSSQDQ